MVVVVYSNSIDGTITRVDARKKQSTYAASRV